MFIGRPWGLNVSQCTWWMDKCSEVCTEIVRTRYADGPFLISSNFFWIPFSTDWPYKLGQWRQCRKPPREKTSKCLIPNKTLSEDCACLNWVLAYKQIINSEASSDVTVGQSLEPLGRYDLMNKCASRLASSSHHAWTSQKHFKNSATGPMEPEGDVQILYKCLDFLAIGECCIEYGGGFIVVVRIPKRLQKSLMPFWRKDACYTSSSMASIWKSIWLNTSAKCEMQLNADNIIEVLEEIYGLSCKSNLSCLNWCIDTESLSSNQSIESEKGGKRFKLDSLFKMGGGYNPLTLPAIETMDGIY